MAEVDGGLVVARVLQERNVRYLFCINGGHVFPILAHLRDHGIKLIHMRHEQATAFAADGYARTTGEPGVCCVTAGCGLTNAITGLALAGATGSAVVCIAGQHPTLEDGAGSFQESYGAEICRTFCKYTKRVLDWPRIGVDLRQAFRAALAPPQGPALVDLPANVLYESHDEDQQFPGGAPYDPDALRAQADPRHVERAVEMLCRAERPLLVGGDGIFWSAAAAEVRELAELTHTPTYCRRAGQGALPEDNALAVRGAIKKPFTGRADLVLAVGFRFWSGEKFGRPPTWSDQARYIHVGANPDQLGLHVAAELPIVGDPKLVLRQLIDTIKEQKLDFSAKRDSAWVREVAAAREKFAQLLAEREETARNHTPIHPDRLVHDIVEAIDDDASIVVDSFTLSGYVSHWFQSRFPGQVVDAGPLAPVGHGVGMAIGVQLARPDKQVIVISGDGGIGIGGFDLETAARYKLPITIVLWNNSSWGPGFEQMPVLKGRTDPFDMLPDIRYDRIAAELGCHGEHVEAPDEITPALRRALDSDKPALVNVVGDKSIGHPSLGGNLLGSTEV